MWMPLDPGYFEDDELSQLGFKKIGKNVRIARNTTFIGRENISIGSNVRIDGNVTFACTTEPVEIGSFVHIGGGSHFSASGGIEIQDFCTISQGVRIYSASDDFSGAFLTNPTTPRDMRVEIRSKVTLEKHSVVGSGSVILPGVALREGTAVGALSLVKDTTPEWSIVAGVPARTIRSRSRELLNLRPDDLL